MGSEPRQGVSIFARILIAFLLVNAVVSSVLIYSAYRFNTSSITRHANESIAQQVATIRDHFDHLYRAEVDRSLRWLVNSSLLDDYLFSSSAQRTVAKKRVEKEFRTMVSDFAGFHSIRFVDYDGMLAIDTELRGARGEPTNIRKPDASADSGVLLALRRLFEHMESLPLLLSSGNMEWFMAPREVHVEGPFMDANGAMYALIGMAKLDLDTAAFGGIVVIQLDLGEFLGELRDVRFFGENPLWVFSGRQETIQAPEKPTITFDPSPYLSPDFQASPRQVDAGPGLVAYQDFALKPGQSFLRIAVAIPSTLLHRDMATALKFFSAVLIASVVVVLVASLYVSRYLTQPIVELASAASRLAKGDLAAQVNVRTTGEVQTLVQSFNRMTADLRETMHARDASLESLRREIGERQRAEDELKRRAEELTEARIAAEAADRAKSGFLASMSHEIRTPINGVLGMIELLVNTRLDTKQNRLAQIARRSVLTLLDLINDILDFSKIEAGKLELAHEPFNLRELMEELGQVFAESAHRKGIELICAIPGQLHTAVRGDSARLRQILTNLLGNAIKFTERGEVVVGVESIRSGEGGETLRFQVRDTGIGIAEDVQSQIFEAFSQADSSMTRRFGGTGLGLGISRQLAEAMGGEMGVRSRLAEGSTFWFTVRLEHVPESVAGPEMDFTRLRGRRALIVDDNATNREILECELASWEMSLESVANGSEALRRMRASLSSGDPFDLVLLDMHMPDMNGMELAREMDAEGSLRGTRMVMLSSVSDEHADLRGELGVRSYLTKPVRQSELFYCLVDVLDDERPRNEERQASVESPPEQATQLGGRILIAEDNVVNQEMAIVMVGLLGCEAAVAADGARAVASADSEPFDLILMDCQMPVMDGFAAAEAIRQRENRDPSRVRVPIVALTANALRGQRERCMEVGMDDFLTKPFTLEQLRETLARWLATDLQTRQPTVASPTPEAKDDDMGGGECDAETPVLDKAALDNIRSLQRQGADDVLRRFATLYLQSSAELLETINGAITRDEAEALDNSAHALKSASANVGAVALAALCKKLETLGARGDLSGAADLLAQIEHEYARVCDALAEECGERAA